MNIQVTKEEFSRLVARCTDNTRSQTGRCYGCVFNIDTEDKATPCNLDKLVKVCEIVKGEG